MAEDNTTWRLLLMGGAGAAVVTLLVIALGGGNPKGDAKPAVAAAGGGGGNVPSGQTAGGDSSESSPAVPLGGPKRATGVQAGEEVPHNRDFAGRAGMILSNTEGEGRGEAIAELLGEWAMFDAPGAGAWVSALPAGDLRNDAAGDLISAWASADPAGAAAWLASSGSLNGETAGVLAGVWGGKEPLKAIAWAATLEEPALRMTAQAAAAGAWAAKDPQSASAWVMTLPANERNTASVPVVQAWAEKDGPAAAAWLASAFGSQPKAMEAPAVVLAMVWSGSSPAGVSRWLNTLPEGEVRDAAATAFAVSAAPQAPSAALTWAMSLGTEEQRYQTVADVCERWYDDANDSFRNGIVPALDAMEDSAMRKAVYAMLYEKDPGFRDQVLALVEEPEPAPAPPPAESPAGDQSAPTPASEEAR